MKRVNNIYSGIIDIRKIRKIYDKRVRVNTKNKTKIERFDSNYTSNITYVKEILANKKYIPGKYNIFIIKEPKIRLIMSQNILDKLINHVVSEEFLLKVFNNTLIDQNVATRINKGTHYGIRLLKNYINKVKNENFYILKFDISKYFFNLDHDILKKLIRKKIKDKDALNILDNIIDSTDAPYVNKEIKKLKEREIKKILKSNNDNKDKLINDVKNLPEYQKGKGLPIGNMTSQALAILYLNEIDHFIKEKLKVKYYIRYMDDGLIISDDKEFLKYCLKEITQLLTKYKLKLNSKTKIYTSKEGFEFLGFSYSIKNNKLIMKVKNQTKLRFKRKMKNLYYLYNHDKIQYEILMQVKSSYLGHLSYGNTKKLVKKTLNKYKFNDEIGVFVKIINNDLVYIN